MKEVIFNYDYLRACILHTAKQDVRFYLCGIYLGDGFMSATDGHKMIIINDECFDGCDYIIPNGVAEFFIKKLKANPMQKDVCLKIGEDGFNIMGLMDHYEYFKFIDGKFPDIKRVDIEKPKESIGNPVFDIKYMADLLKSFQILNKSSFRGLSIICNGDAERAYVEMTENAHGVLMPMRI